jgi:hypothetical protein
VFFDRLSDPLLEKSQFLAFFLNLDRERIPFNGLNQSIHLKGFPYLDKRGVNPTQPGNTLSTFKAAFFFLPVGRKSSPAAAFAQR